MSDGDCVMRCLRRTKPITKKERAEIDQKIKDIREIIYKDETKEVGR